MKNKFLCSVFLICTIMALEANAQTWNTLIGNNLNGLQWLGSNGTSTGPLELKTIETGANALPINFWTNGTQQMTLSSYGSVGLGVTAYPQVKLNVYLNSSYTGIQAGVNSWMTSSVACQATYGFFGTAQGDNSGRTAGIYAQSSGASIFNLGGEFWTVGSVGKNACGVYSTASLCPTNFGGILQGGSSSILYPSKVNIGVYGYAHFIPTLIAPKSFAIYGDMGSKYGYWAGYFNGNVHVIGTVSSTSDSIFKINVHPLTGDSAMRLIRGLKPKTFVFDTASYHSIYLPAKSQYGLIAQEVNRLIPNLVDSVTHPAYADTTGTILHDSINYLGLNYTGFIPIIIAAIKQLDSISQARPAGATNAISVISDTIMGLAGPEIFHHYEWGDSSLKHNTVVPMIDNASNEWNIYFTGQSVMHSGMPANVGVGYSKDSILRAKLDVQNVNSTPDGYNYINQYAGRFYNTGVANPTAGGSLLAHVLNPTLFPDPQGVNGRDDVIGAAVNYGGDFSASNANVNVGVRGWAIDSFSHANGGLVGVATNSSEGNYGTYTIAYGNNGSDNYGIYASGTQGSGANYGVYAEADNSGAFNAAVYGYMVDTIGSDYAGYFDGKVMSTAGYYTISDSKFKQNIQTLTADSALAILNTLKPKSYTLNSAQYPGVALQDGKQYGLLSEDVEKVLPQLVKNSVNPAKKDFTGNVIHDAVNYKALNYTGFVPLLIAADQKLDSTNKAQGTKIDSLQAQLARTNAMLQQVLNCCQNTGSNNPGARMDTVSVALNNNTEIILNQNDPNPFSEQTIINYSIPSSVNNAQIKFYDNNGMVLRTVPITTRGSGSMIVYASNLSSGIYTYALIADGRLIDTKKMVCQK